MPWRLLELLQAALRLRRPLGGLGRRLQGGLGVALGPFCGRSQLARLVLRRPRGCVLLALGRTGVLERLTGLGQLLAPPACLLLPALPGRPRAGHGKAGELLEAAGRDLLLERAREHGGAGDGIERRCSQRRRDTLEERIRHRFAGLGQEVSREPGEDVERLALLDTGAVELGAVAAAQHVLLRACQPLARLGERAQLPRMAPGELVDRPGRHARLAKRLHPLGSIA